MGGGLMQLVAYGAQDIYLTGNPQITFFKVVYRRHTNFSMECIQQTIDGTSTLGTSETSGVVTISRNGDLLSKVYVRCDANDGSDVVQGDELISKVECEIGGQLIDRQNNEWMKLWAELTIPASKAEGYKYMTHSFHHDILIGGTTGGHNQQDCWIPLYFWFCRNPGLALPLIALQYHEVKLKFTWGASALASKDGSDHSAHPTCEVWCDYIYLDTDERRRFAQVSHEYLIEQVQNQGASSSATVDLNFNHPVKELIWTTAGNGITNEKTKLVLNGHDRFAQQNREYFQLRQPYDHHTSIPHYNIKEHEHAFLASPIESSNDVLDAITDGHSTTAGDVDVMSLTVTGQLTFHTTVDASLNVGDQLVVTHVPATLAATVATQILTVTASAGNGYNYTVNGGTLNCCNAVTDAGHVSVRIISKFSKNFSRTSSYSKDTNIYSFALKPEEHQPSGTCNFSRIDNAQLKFTSSVNVDNIYAVNYNVLRIMSGMGGLAYSN